MAGLGVGAWWWTRPGGSWACFDRSPVECQAALNVFDVEGSPESGVWKLAVDGFDVTPDRSVVAAGLVRRGESGEPPAGLLLVHDLTASAQPEPVTTAPDGERLTSVEVMNWSPDGTRLVALVSTARADHLVVLDRTARYVADLPLPRDEPSCSSRIGLSADGTTILCDRSLYDLASGDRLRLRPNEVDTAWGDQLGVSVLLTDDDTSISAEEPGIVITPGGPVELPRAGFGTVRLAVDPASTMLAVVDRTPAAAAWRQPRRNRAEGRVTWIDIESRSVTATATLEGRPYDADPDLADGWTALLTTDGDVLFLRPGA